MKYPILPPIPRVRWLQEMRPFDSAPEHRCLPVSKNQASVTKCVSCAITSAMEWSEIVAGNGYQRIDENELHSQIVEPDGLAHVGMGLPVAMTDGVSGVRIVNVWHCPTFDHAFTAALLGLGIITSLPAWYMGNHVDQDGWLVTGGGIPQGHSIFGYKPAMRRIASVPRFGIWHMQSVGSFSPQTGHRCVISESQMAGAECFAVQTTSRIE